LEKLSLQLLAPDTWRWLLLLAPLLALAFWTYYRILAPLSRPARWALWTLRGLAFVIILFALLQPVLTVVTRGSGRPHLAVLLDRSASMALPGGDEGSGTRAGEALRIAGEAGRALDDRARLHWYGFSDEVHATAAESAAVPEGNTGLGVALDEVLTRSGSDPLSGILLLSDGVNTVGSDPVRAAAGSPVPIFTVAVGAAEPPRDVEIRGIRTNPTAYAGEPLPLRVTLASWGLRGEPVTVEVRDGSQVLERREVRLAGDRGMDQEMAFDLRPARPGLNLFEVTVTGTNDGVPQNNVRQVAVNVLDRKTQVLVIAGRLDWDFKFLRRALDADTALVYHYLVRTRPGAYESLTRPQRRLPASESDLKEFAAVILTGFQEARLEVATQEALRRFVNRGGGLFVMGPLPPGVRDGSLAAVLPGSLDPAGRSTGNAVPISLTPEGRRHPVTDVLDDPAGLDERWASLPPVHLPQGAIIPSADARTLLEGRTPRGSQALLAVAFRGQGKSAWLAAEAAWRWAFLPERADRFNAVYPRFALSMVRWLAEPMARERLQVNPTRLVYQNGDRVGFTASLWDESFLPTGDAEVKIEVTTSGDSIAPVATVSLQRAGAEGLYEGTIPPLPPGPYAYKATAQTPRQETAIRGPDGRFWVESMGPEFARTWADTATLELLARSSGGRSARAGNLAELLGAIPQTVRPAGRIREVELWNHWVLFAAFVTVLSIEWFLRRRRGMA